MEVPIAACLRYKICQVVVWARRKKNILLPIILGLYERARSGVRSVGNMPTTGLVDLVELKSQLHAIEGVIVCCCPTKKTAHSYC